MTEVEAPKTEKKIDSDETAIAAGHYAHMCRTIKGYVSVMNGKGLARVLNALAAFPYGESYPKFRAPAEQQLFTMMLSVQSAKAKIAEALSEEEMSSISTEAVTGIVEEELAKLKGEEHGKVE